MNEKILSQIRERHKKERFDRASARGRGSRTKGHNFERLIANVFKEVDPTAARNLEEYREGTVDIRTKLPLAIQCKRMRKWPSPYKVMQQASDGARDGEIPIGIVKVDWEPEPLVIIQFEHAKMLWGLDEAKWIIRPHKIGNIFNAEWRELRFDAKDWQIPIIKQSVQRSKRTICTLYFIHLDDFMKQIKLVYGTKT